MKPKMLFSHDFSIVIAAGSAEIVDFAMHHKAWLSANGFVLKFDDGHCEYVPPKFWSYKIVGMYFRNFL